VFTQPSNLGKHALCVNITIELRLLSTRLRGVLMQNLSMGGMEILVGPILLSKTVQYKVTQIKTVCMFLFLIDYYTMRSHRTHNYLVSLFNAYQSTNKMQISLGGSMH